MKSALRGRGFSLIELLVVVAVLLTLMAIAIPNLMRARGTANEASAVASLRAISTGQASYQQTFGVGYAPSLLALGPGAGPPTAAAADLIDQVLASGTKTGYVFFYNPVDSNGDGRMDTYTIQANPIVPGQSGSKYFFTDESNVIRFSLLGPATVASQPIPPQ